MTTFQFYVSREDPSTEGNSWSSPLICSHQYHSDDDNNGDDDDADIVDGGGDDDDDDDDLIMMQSIMKITMM